MEPAISDAVPVGVVELDRDGCVRRVNSWALEWFGMPSDQVVGVPWDHLLQFDDELLPADFRLGALMMRHAGLSDRAALVTRTEGPDGAVLVIVDGSARYSALRALRQSYRLAARTQSRLELVIDASLAFSTATSDDELAGILADTTARAYSAEEAAVLLLTPSGALSLAAGSNPLETAPDMARAGSLILGMRDVLTVSSRSDADALSPTLGRAMREVGVEALLAAPLEHKNRTYGVLACFFRHQRQFDAEAAPLAEALAGQATQALVALRLKTSLEHAATHDDVTGLPNRRLLEEQLQVRAPGDGGRLAMIFLDVDRFKEINDQHGHALGDEVLREVGRRLLAVAGERDIVARYGGDEFVVASRVTNAASATDLAERLRAAVAPPFDFLGPDAVIGVSVGVALEDEYGDSRTVKHLIRAADQAMYAAKSQGGARVVSLTPATG